jgi:hypothetical protein
VEQCKQVLNSPKVNLIMKMTKYPLIGIMKIILKEATNKIEIISSSAISHNKGANLYGIKNSTGGE